MRRWSSGWKGAAACVLAAGLGFAARAEVPKAGPLAQPAAASQVGLPADLVSMVSPGGQPASAEMVALGEKLFFDGRLSADGTVACSTCHDPEKGFTDHRTTSQGIRKQVGPRNAPTVLNAMFFQTEFWDGRAASLEEQAKLPILNPIEMGRGSPAEVMAAVAAVPEYAEAFPRIFGHPPTYDDLGAAIAAYERTQAAFDSPFDRYLAGDEKALSPAAKKGWSLFNGKARCISCHGVSGTSPLFTDDKFHNIGVAAHKTDFPDLARQAAAAARNGDKEKIDKLALESHFSEVGRFLVTREFKDLGGFKTSGLRNLLVTQPYFHDGSAATLWDVLDHYNKGGEQNPYLDGGIQRLNLSERELDDLVDFLASLTSSRYQAAADVELARQRALKETARPSRDLAAVHGSGHAGNGMKGPFGDPLPEASAKKDPARVGGL